MISLQRLDMICIYSKSQDCLNLLWCKGMYYLPSTSSQYSAEPCMYTINMIAFLNVALKLTGTVSVRETSSPIIKQRSRMAYHNRYMNYYY